MSRLLTSSLGLNHKLSKIDIRKHLLKQDFGDFCLENPSVQLRLKRAAVLVPLFFKNDELHVLLTVRAADLRMSPGEVSFPGGKCDPCDADNIAAALREAEEEIGLKKEEVEIISRLPPFMTSLGYSVTPVVAFIQNDFIYRVKPNPAEVQDVFSVPLESFLSKRHHFVMSTYWPGRFFFIHFFRQRKKGKTTPVTFGLTAYICIAVACLIFQRDPEFKMEVTFDRRDMSRSFMVAFLVHRSDVLMNAGRTLMQSRKKEIMQNAIPKAKL